jgi:Domain of unknown function (DUF4157)
MSKAPQIAGLFCNVTNFFTVIPSMRVQIKENSWVAKLAAVKMKADKVAIVFGNTIHLHNTSRQEFLADKKWVCHELKHVQQYQQNGFAGFIAKYVADWMKNGYYNNRFEIEARQSEGEEGLLKKTEFC